MRDPAESDDPSSASGLDALANFRGEPLEFWRRYLRELTRMCAAPEGCLLIRREKGWAPVARMPSTNDLVDDLSGVDLDAWAQQLKEESVRTLDGNGSAADEQKYLVASLRPEGGDGEALIVLSQNGRSPDGAHEKLKLALNIPGLFEARRQAESVKKDAARLANALDLMALLNGQTKFAAAAMSLCNELASRFGCERVGLGWLEKNYITVKALSHTEKIEPKMEAVQQLAAAMEEACDQEEEIVWPRPEGQAFVTRDHEIYAKAQSMECLATLPIFEASAAEQPEGATPRPVGAVILERGKPPFGIEELRTLRLMLDQAARPLGELHRSDRWIGSRWAAASRKWAARLLGPEHTWWKILALALAIGLLVLVFGRKEYRVEGSFALKTDAMAQLSAPFDGHIETAGVRPGDLVEKDQALLTLDKRELLLQKEAAAAERDRHAADALKAESTGDVAGMRIAQAREAQARAQMDIVNDRLARAELKAPFAGVVMEGDLRERIAAPVQKGDVLLKVGRIEDMYLVVEVPERDIQDVAEGAIGRAAFASLPGEPFAFVVERISPAARTKEKGNLFTVRCRFTDAPQDWWRPGMSGIARIDAGRRSLLWIFTHRTVDFLRMWWW